MYEISFIKKFDTETSNVTVKGKVTFTLPPKHVVSPAGAERSYDFWSQFFVIKDSTDSVGVNCTFGSEEDKKQNNDIVEVRGTIHKYLAENKETGKEEEKIVLNKARMIEPEKEKEKTKEKPKTQTVNVNNEDSKMLDDQEIRKEAVTIAFAYGDKHGVANCFKLAELIESYIKSGKIEEEKSSSESKKQDKKTKEKETKKEKPAGIKETESTLRKKETKTEKTTKDLEELYKKGQDIGLSTWVELIKFAVEKEVFPVGTTIEYARPKLLANYEDCYDSLLDTIDISKNIKDLPEDEQSTDEIPF